MRYQPMNQSSKEQQPTIAKKAVTDIEQVLRLHGKTMVTTSKPEIDLYLNLYIAGASMALLEAMNKETEVSNT